MSQSRFFLSVMFSMLLGAAFIESRADATAAPMPAFSQMNSVRPALRSVWLGTSSYNVPQGLTSLFYHYPCPANRPVAVNGGFTSNENSSYTLAFNAPRLDESPPNYGEWGWGFYWPSGAPSGLVLKFSVFCAQ